jgi:hypothetical protein
LGFADLDGVEIIRKRAPGHKCPSLS